MHKKIFLETPIWEIPLSCFAHEHRSHSYLMGELLPDSPKVAQSCTGSKKHWLSRRVKLLFWCWWYGAVTDLPCYLNKKSMLLNKNHMVLLSLLHSSRFILPGKYLYSPLLSFSDTHHSKSSYFSFFPVSLKDLPFPAKCKTSSIAYVHLGGNSLTELTQHLAFISQLYKVDSWSTPPALT